MKAMVLAAGRGERLRPLTDHTPKPLLAVRGEPLLFHHLRALARAGIREVVINLAWLGGQIRAAVGDGAAFGLAVRYSEEPEGALETGGGLFQALPLLGEGPFLVVNGDIHTDINFGALRLAARDHAHLVLVPNPPQHPNGDFALREGRVRLEGGPRHTYSGVGLYTPGFFAGCSAGRFPLLPLLRRAIEADVLGGQLHAGAWTDVGTAERLAQLNEPR